MKILGVNPNNYDSHREIMESTRVYRQENLWNIEYYGSLIEAYRETDPLRCTFVALSDDGNMIGMTQYDRELGRLRQVIVDPKFRSKGIGSMLVGKVIEAAKEDNQSKLMVHGLVESKGFYSKLGFSDVGEMYESGDKK